MNSLEATHATQGRALRALARMLGAASPGAATYDHDGITACAVPAAKDDADANFVAYTEPGAVASALPEITASYETAGVGSWVIYVPESDDQTARSLTTAGYRVRDKLPAIMLDLSSFEPRPVGDLDYDVYGDVATLGRLNAAAYDRPELERAFAQTPDVPGLRVYRARLDGQPACALLTIDVPHADSFDCAAYFLATVPNARRRGLAPRLFTAALLDARERGCVTCSGQASPMGAPIYARMGFQTVFHFSRLVPGTAR